MKPRFSSELLVFSILAVLLLGCGSEESTPSIELAETPVLSGRGSYALVTIEYARLYREPAVESETVAHARRGDVLAVLANTPDQLWFRLQAPEIQGWVEVDSLRLFSTEEQARNARGLLDIR